MTVAGPCRVLLIGMMGSGKSTIGRLLSEATGWPYIDNDELVREFHGATARQILAERGEAPMRAAESDALARGVRAPAPTVIGVAAGTILEAANRERLRMGGIVVWLRADAAAIESRAMGGDHRPWLDTVGGSWIRETVTEREPLYASIADTVIDTGTKTVDESTAKLLAWLGTVAACHPAVEGRVADVYIDEDNSVTLSAGDIQVEDDVFLVANHSGKANPAQGSPAILPPILAGSDPGGDGHGVGVND